MSESTDLRERLIGEGLDPGAWSNGPGDRYPAHEHEYDKIIVVASGSIRFGLAGDDRAVDLSPGDRLELPARTAHDAIVGDEGVACLEAHLRAGTFPGVARREAGSW